MTVLRSIIMAFSMFSKIPMPHIKWEEKSMRYMLAFFPLVGVVIGLLLYLWMWVCTWCGLNQMVWSAGLLLIPLAVSGAIHLDGFCDVSDALSSHAEPARKREILKDSHVGAFAVICAGAYLICHFAFGTQVPMTLASIGLLGLAPVLSRATSGIISLAYAGAGGEGMLSTFRGAAHKTGTLVVLAIFAVAAAACMIVLCWPAGLAMMLVDLAVALYMYYVSHKQFEGMSGDLSGFFLQVSELGMLIALAVCWGWTL